MGLRDRVGRLAKQAGGERGGGGTVVYMPWKKPRPEHAGRYPPEKPPGVYVDPWSGAVLVVYDPDAPGTAPGQRDYVYGG